MIGLALWVAAVAVRIEIVNVAAGNYLPRHSEFREDGTLVKWRIDLSNSPRNTLRHLVETVGLLQYPLTFVLLGFAAFHSLSPRWHRERSIAGCSGIIAATALGLAIYRAYFPSLGW